MEVFEAPPPHKTIIDDALPLSCTFETYRLVDRHIEYVIRVQRGYYNGKHWTVFKRYNDFVALDKEIEARRYDIELPPKKIFGNFDREFIVQRQNKLQKYMNQVLENLILSSSVWVKRFLDPENYCESFQDSALQYASMALRGKPDFHNLKPLPYIGWRFKKHYCSVKRYNEAKREYILTWISEYGPNRCLSDKELQSTFKVFLDLQHPFIIPIVTGNCYSSGTLIIRSNCVRGSLRELIYDRAPFDSFIRKCSYRSERILLPSDAIYTIAIQVLHALVYLHQKGIPYGNLHSGNIFIEDDVAKISDVENGIFGLTSIYQSYLVENRRVHSMEDIDVYCFGHVLYEMVFGERLQSPFCDMIPPDCDENLKPILELILSSSPKSKLPSVKAILSTAVFDVSASNIVLNEPPRCKVTTSTKEFLGRCRKTIEDRMHKEQNELRKLRKITYLKEQMKIEEQNGSISSREKRKMKRVKSQVPLTASSPEQFENMSNGSTPTSVSTESSFRNSSCDKLSENPPEVRATPPSSAPTPVSDERNVFLQSIVNFNKGNLKQTKAKEAR
ncbi:hypothetical protein V9T40_004111 [Parthenolecanium corni]|uniref:PX domain-containing protein kinase-like protein n=1 Tax=Parthenolecanium corni TaxID=536013 RepID=A0AAN9Y4I7_9HEMI